VVSGDELPSPLPQLTRAPSRVPEQSRCFLDVGAADDVAFAAARSC